MKSKIQIKSVLEQVAEKVFLMDNVNEAKAFVKTFIDEKGIKPEDKKLIIYNVENCETMKRLNQYICNALLKYEGLSIHRR
jgi:hypothetical protein